MRILRISNIGVQDNRHLFSITSSKIYNKDKREQVKAIIFYKSAMDSNPLLFETFKLKIGYMLRALTCK